MRIYRLLPILLLTGCSFFNHHDSNSSVNLSALVEIDWTVTTLDNKPVIKDSRMSLLVSAEGKVRGNAGVNNYFGKWQIVGRDIIASKMAATKMARLGPAGIMQQEQLYLKLLSEVTSWQLSAGKLQLFQDKKLLVTLGQK